MDGMHDLGGRQGFGRVRHSPEAKAFHAPWEKRVNALVAVAAPHPLAIRRAVAREPRGQGRALVAEDEDFSGNAAASIGHALDHGWPVGTKPHQGLVRSKAA